MVVLETQNMSPTLRKAILDQQSCVKAEAFLKLLTPVALSKLLKCEGGAGADIAILPYVGHLQLISTLKIGADCCQLC